MLSVSIVSALLGSSIYQIFASTVHSFPESDIPEVSYKEEFPFDWVFDEGLEYETSHGVSSSISEPMANTIVSQFEKTRFNGASYCALRKGIQFAEYMTGILTEATHILDGSPNGEAIYAAMARFVLDNIPSLINEVI